MSWKRKSFKERVARCGLKMFVPPESGVNVAKDRTEGMVWLYVSESRGGTSAMEDLRTLVRSAYLQGVTDAAEAMARQGLVLTEVKEPA